MPNSMPKCQTGCSVTSPKWRKRQIGVISYEKAPFMMRTYNRCRFSPLMSSGAALTWTAAGLLIDLSSPAFSPECRFPRQLTGDSHCDRSEEHTSELQSLRH